MRRILILAAVIALLTAPAPVAQGPGVEPVEPFKVGTFDIHGVPHVGLVLRDSLVIDIEIATYALEAHPEYPHVPMPEDMLELIGRWDYGLKYRLFEMVNYVVNNDLLTGDGRADYVYDVSELRTRPPIMYPGKILNAAVNFYSHVFEGATPDERAAEMRRRREERGVPYLFQKPSRGAVVGNGDPIVIPYGRDRTDWEVELGAVIGRAAKYVSADDAQDYVFGYIVSIDVSDRGGRPPGGAPFTSDWFVGKGHDTFAPQGPWIAPKEFYGDPMQNLRQTLSVGGQTLQEARAGDMIPLAVGDHRVRLVDHHALPGRRDQQRHLGRHRRRRGADPRRGGPLPQAGRGGRGQHRRHRHAAHAGRGRRGAAGADRRRAAAGQDLSRLTARDLASRRSAVRPSGHDLGHPEAVVRRAAAARPPLLAVEHGPAPAGHQLLQLARLQHVAVSPLGVGRGQVQRRDEQPARPHAPAYRREQRPVEEEAVDDQVVRPLRNRECRRARLEVRDVRPDPVAAARPLGAREQQLDAGGCSVDRVDLPAALREPHRVPPRAAGQVEGAVWRHVGDSGGEQRQRIRSDRVPAPGVARVPLGNLRIVHLATSWSYTPFSRDRQQDEHHPRARAWTDPSPRRALARRVVDSPGTTNRKSGRDMGEIRTEVKLENADDRALVRRGHGTESEVRRTTVDGIVDTGAVTLMLPQNVVERLGLERQGTAFVTYADERRDERALAGPVSVGIGSRTMVTECIVGPPLSEPLIGQVVLERLDLIADCASQTVTPRHPDYPLFKLK